MLSYILCVCVPGNGRGAELEQHAHDINACSLQPRGSLTRQVNYLEYRLTI